MLQRSKWSNPVLINSIMRYSAYRNAKTQASVLSVLHPSVDCAHDIMVDGKHVSLQGQSYDRCWTMTLQNALHWKFESIAATSIGSIDPMSSHSPHGMTVSPAQYSSQLYHKAQLLEECVISAYKLLPLFAFPHTISWHTTTWNFQNPFSNLSHQKLQPTSTHHDGNRIRTRWVSRGMHALPCPLSRLQACRVDLLRPLQGMLRRKGDTREKGCLQE